LRDPRSTGTFSPRTLAVSKGVPSLLLFVVDDRPPRRSKKKREGSENEENAWILELKPRRCWSFNDQLDNNFAVQAHRLYRKENGAQERRDRAVSWRGGGRLPSE
jgi:hypothetical protein